MAPMLPCALITRAGVAVICGIIVAHEGESVAAVDYL